MAFKYSDLAEYKRQWRATCKARKIDPEHGATVFQVIDWKAEQAKKAKAEEAALRRWATPEALEVWKTWSSVSAQIFDLESSKLERQVIASIRRQASSWNAPAAEAVEENLDDVILDLWREVKHEMGIRDRVRLPEIKSGDYTLWLIDFDEDEAWSVTKDQHIFEPA